MAATKTVLQQVLQAKIAKENNAIVALQQATTALQQAITRLQEAEHVLSDYIAWRIKEEKALYAELQGQVVRLPELEKINETVACLYAKDLELEHAIQQAETHKQDAEQALESARLTRLAAAKAVEKFTELCDRESQQLALEKQRKEELELEELNRPQRVSHHEW